MDVIRGIFDVAKVIFVILDIFLLFIFVFSFAKGWGFRPRISFREKARRRTFTLKTAVFRERWQSVLRRFSAGSPEATRLAVIEADGLIDAILKGIGLEGEHMADRLSKVNPESLSSLNRLWRAHRLRNELVHTPGFSLSAEEARGALEDYESFLKEIGVLPK